jgi:hypothetical protein
MSDRFQFLKSYADVIQNVAQADKWLAWELSLKIINYWIYWIDEDSWNPMVEALFIQIKIMIDKWLEITGKNKENWMKWWRPKNPNKTEIKPNDNPDITKIENRKKKIENRKDKIENNIEEKIIKKKFLDFVQLSDDEYQKLIEKFWKKYADESIEKLNNYLWSTGKRYKSHYFTILNWNKREWPPSKSNIELLQERDRQRRLEEAQEVLNRSKNWNEANDKNGTFNRRENFIG